MSEEATSSRLSSPSTPSSNCSRASVGAGLEGQTGRAGGERSGDQDHPRHSGGGREARGEGGRRLGAPSSIQTRMPWSSFGPSRGGSTISWSSGVSSNHVYPSKKLLGSQRNRYSRCCNGLGRMCSAMTRSQRAWCGHRLACRAPRRRALVDVVHFLDVELPETMHETEFNIRVEELADSLLPTQEALNSSAQSSRKPGTS